MSPVSTTSRVTLRSASSCVAPCSMPASTRAMTPTAAARRRRCGERASTGGASATRRHAGISQQAKEGGASAVQGSWYSSGLAPLFARDGAGAGARQARHAAHNGGVWSAVVCVPGLRSTAVMADASGAHGNACNVTHRGSGSGGVPVTMGFKTNGSAKATMANGSSRHTEPARSACTAAAIASSCPATSKRVVWPTMASHAAIAYSLCAPVR
jgi:hypothetical protein